MSEYLKKAMEYSQKQNKKIIKRAVMEVSQSIIKDIEEANRKDSALYDDAGYLNLNKK